MKCTHGTVTQNKLIAKMENVISISRYTDNESIRIVCMFDNRYRSAITFASKGLVGRNGVTKQEQRNDDGNTAVAAAVGEER